MTLRQVNQFHTLDPKQLDRELSTFEDNVAAETDSIRAGYLPVFRAASYSLVSSPFTVLASIDCQHSIDTSLGNCAFVLPALSGAKLTREIRLIKQVSTGTITVSSVDGTTINGASSVSITAVGVTRFFLDSRGYFS